MTLATTPEDAEAFEALAALHEVEVSRVAIFTNDGRFHVKYGEESVAMLPIEFLHDGVPQLQLSSVWQNPHQMYSIHQTRQRHKLLDLLARPNIASKESWVRQYDHEVIAQTAVKPFVAERDVA